MAEILNINSLVIDALEILGGQAKAALNKVDGNGNTVLHTAIRESRDRIKAAI